MDLNLLLVFEALYRLRSVTAAADELSISPSACSHALARLRKEFGDDLFVRYGNAMQPTAHAEQLATIIIAALDMLGSRLEVAGSFNPATTTQTLTLAASDFTAFSFLPHLIERLEMLAPRLRIKVVPATHRDSLDDLFAGRAQVVLGFSDEFSDSSDGVEALEGPTEAYVVMVRQDHQRIRGSLTMEQYLAERHVAVIPWEDEGSVIDDVLRRSGIQRDVAIQLSSMMAAPFIVSNSQFLITLPSRVAWQFGRTGAFSFYPTPFVTPGYTLKALFHARHAGTPALRWLKTQVQETIRTMHHDQAGFSRVTE